MDGVHYTVHGVAKSRTRLSDLTNLTNVEFEDSLGYSDIFFFFFPVAPCCLEDLSSPTRDQTQAPVRENKDSQPLDHQGILYIVISTVLSLPVHEHGISFHLFVSLFSLISVL